MTEELSRLFAGMKIAWLVPLVEPGSGGLQTIFRHVSFLEQLGAVCHVITCQFSQCDNARATSRILAEDYQCEPDAVIDQWASGEEYDIAVATMNTTVAYAQELHARKTVYFVQDYEPSFYFVGDEYMSARSTYDSGASIITIGCWLAHKLHEEHDACAWHTDFAADQEIYRPLGLHRRKAICAILQPTKPRRCAQLVADTFELVHALAPDIELIAYGSDERFSFSVPVVRKGLVSKEECNRLYNECAAGLCISTTNPSRIPFEMMAAGLPVVDIYQDNTLWDFTPETVSLAHPDPASLATALLSLVEDSSRAQRASDAGVSFMRGRSGASESQGFARALYEIATSGEAYGDVLAQSYLDNPVVAPHEIQAVYDMLKRNKLLKALVRPAPDCAMRYARVNMGELPDGVDARSVYCVVHIIDPAAFRVEHYEAQVDEEGRYWAQVDFRDFDFYSGLYHCQAFVSPADGGSDIRFAERSVRTHFDEPEELRISSENEVALPAVEGLTFAFSEVPFSRSARSMMKHLIPASAVDSLRSVIARVR